MENTKKAMISGANGQDGSYLCQYLLNIGYQVYAGVRDQTPEKLKNFEFLKILDHPRLVIVNLNVDNKEQVFKLLSEYQPDEFYNMAAFTIVAQSYLDPFESMKASIGTLNILEGIRMNANKKIRFFQASSSEIFGNSTQILQTEETIPNPKSPYGVAKLCSMLFVNNYRANWKLHASSGILYGHESPLRGIQFVTGKISKCIAAILNGQDEILEIGNLNAQRDWGYAPDYVKAMHLILQQDEPQDYIISSGKTHSVREWIENAFEIGGIKIEWHGEGVHEYGFDAKSNKTRVIVNQNFFRPESFTMKGDNSKICGLGWKPTTTFDEIVKIMLEKEIKILKESCH